MHDLILNYPNDTIQSAVEPDKWWVEEDSASYSRGRLVRVFAPHVDQLPYTLTPVGRAHPTEHNEAHVKISPLDIRSAIWYPNLPVAGLPQYKNEIRAVYRAKKRPALIVCSGGDRIEASLTKDKAKWQTAPTILVAPFYGADEDGSRCGFNPAFVERVRRCEYPQFIWEKLPIGGSSVESLLRLDHIQPIGKSQDSVEITKYRLSDRALAFFDDWLSWLFRGNLDADSDLAFFREELLKIPYLCQPQ